MTIKATIKLTPEVAALLDKFSDSLKARAATMSSLDIHEERRRLKDYYNERQQALEELDQPRYYALNEKIKRLERWLMSFTYR